MGVSNPFRRADEETPDSLSRMKFRDCQRVNVPGRMACNNCIDEESGGIGSVANDEQVVVWSSFSFLDFTTST
jgi:hypothetical protein